MLMIANSVSTCHCYKI